MILRRVTRHVKDQNWFAVGLDFVIVVVGVFIGIQVANWNDERLENVRKVQIVEALIADLKDAIMVQEYFIEQIELGLSEWEQSHARGERPAPYYFRITGSETAPDTWGMLQQMQLADLLDPVTLFDLSFYYSRLNGVGRKYIRYVTFVEDSVLPYSETGKEIFYEDGKSSLGPTFTANMDRLRDFRSESKQLGEWANCLVFRLQSEKLFGNTCLRAGFFLNGMERRTESPSP
ncbi:MAG: hypothetical protein OEM64_07895 [Gammaproteobacteria bacterium]|nr:hypothetical protein [Gammaproteobacteria bacterium]